MSGNYVVTRGDRAAPVRDTKSRPTVKSMGKPTMNVRDPRNIGNGA
jgi:hypothetical protein